MESDVKLEQELLEANDPEMVRLRKDRNILTVAGTGVLLFGLWSVIKTYTLMFEDSSEIFGDIPELLSIGIFEIIFISVFVIDNCCKITYFKIRS